MEFLFPKSQHLPCDMNNVFAIFFYLIPLYVKDDVNKPVRKFLMVAHFVYLTVLTECPSTFQKSVSVPKTEKIKKCYILIKVVTLR